MLRALPLLGLLAGLLVLVDAAYNAYSPQQMVLEPWLVARSKGQAPYLPRCQLNGQAGTCVAKNRCPGYIQQYDTANRVQHWHYWWRRWDIRCSKGYSTAQPIVCCTGRTVSPPTTTAEPIRSDRSTSCGQSPFSRPLVVGGTVVRRLGDFPWMVLLKRNITSSPYACGGALINSRWVLTAAHCFSGHAEDVPKWVRVRDLDTSTRADDIAQEPPKDVAINDTFLHPNFSRPGFHSLHFNDIALIKLNENLTFSDNLHPLCLPSNSEPPNGYDNEDVFVAGWGRTEYGAEPSGIMNWADVKVRRQSYCRSVYPAITDQHLCANGDAGTGLRSDTCLGDSGGPMMRPAGVHGYDQRWEVIGVTSVGRGCGHPENPGVYTRVDSFLPWIQETINANSHTTDSE